MAYISITSLLTLIFSIEFALNYYSKRTTYMRYNVNVNTIFLLMTTLLSAALIASNCYKLHINCRGLLFRRDTATSGCTLQRLDEQYDVLTVSPIISYLMSNVFLYFFNVFKREWRCTDSVFFPVYKTNLQLYWTCKRENSYYSLTLCLFNLTEQSRRKMKWRWVFLFYFKLISLGSWIECGHWQPVLSSGIRAYPHFHWNIKLVFPFSLLVRCVGVCLRLGLYFIFNYSLVITFIKVNIFGISTTVLSLFCLLNFVVKLPKTIYCYT